jgi:hypothetical protein
MTQSLQAYFDGKVIVPQEPVPLPAGTPLRVRIEVAEDMPRKKTRPRRVIGLGLFNSGIADLGSNKKHLKGFGR